MHPLHYIDVIMGAMAFQITSLTIVYPTVYSGADQRKYQSSASLAFVWGIRRWPVNSLHKGPVTWKMFPFDDVIMALDRIDPDIQCSNDIYLCNIFHNYFFEDLFVESANHYCLIHQCFLYHMWKFIPFKRIVLSLKHVFQICIIIFI